MPRVLITQTKDPRYRELVGDKLDYRPGEGILVDDEGNTYESDQFTFTHAQPVRVKLLDGPYAGMTGTYYPESDQFLLIDLAVENQNWSYCLI